MSDPLYQSPISPGRSWYEDSCGERPTYPVLSGDRQCDVVVVGGGFCGLTTALHLAKSGTNVVLIEAHRFGDGASGRNGGQMGFGQRAEVSELEKELGLERAKALWDMAEDAKKSLLSTAEDFNIDMEFQPGQLTPMHKKRYEADVLDEAENLNQRYGYSSISYLDQAEMADRLGSDHYYGGTRDTGTGHIHPMKTVIGLAKAAQSVGALLYENTACEEVSHSASNIKIKTATGTITASKCLLALNGHHGDLVPELTKSVMPIQSFIGATEPLEEKSSVLPGHEAVDDSRFVVRYFRKSRDNRLLFGGREAYGKSSPGDIERAIRGQISEVYPDLTNVHITHAWGGNVAITMPRLPYVRELKPGLWTAGGFSGHGVMMANYTGRMIAENWLDQSDQIKLFRELKIPSFPGGKHFRNPLKILALTWYAMLDRI